MNIPDITALLVDDEASNIDVLRGILPKSVKVKAAISGMLALKIASKKLPDIVFLDVQMPGMSGDDVAQQLRSLPDGEFIKIVYVSGSTLPEGIASEDGFLLKPVQRDKVDDMLTQLFKE